MQLYIFGTGKSKQQLNAKKVCISSGFEELYLSIGPKSSSYHCEILRRAFNYTVNKNKKSGFAWPVQY
jgi:hypothetical protein